jgi:hypothetical protein
MDYNLFLTISEQLRELLGVLLYLGGLLTMLLLVSVRKRLKRLERKLEDMLNKKHQELLEKDATLLKEELDTRKIINPTLSYQAAKQDLLKNLQLHAQEKEKEVDTKW